MSQPNDIIITVTRRGPVAVLDDRETVDGVHLSLLTEAGEPVYAPEDEGELAIIPPERESPLAWMGPVLTDLPPGVDWDDWLEAMRALCRADVIRIRRPAPATGVVEIVTANTAS